MLTNTRSGIQHANHFTGVVGLMAPDQLRFIDHFVKNADTGRINWYRLFNVVLPYTQSSSIARKLPEVWLMINMDSKWAGQANDDRSEKNPVRNSNPSAFHRYMFGGGNNLAVITGTIIPSRNVPRPSWGVTKENRAEIAKIYCGFEDLIRQHPRDTDEYKKALNKVFMVSQDIFKQHEANLESNYVIYVDDNQFMPFKGVDGVGSNASDPALDSVAYLSDPKAPMTWVPMINNFSLFFHVNRGATGMTLANSTELQFGMREVGKTEASKRHQCALYGTTYDRRQQRVEIRVSATDVNTIAYINNAPMNNAPAVEGEEAIDPHHVIPTRGSRALVFHDFMMTKSPYAEIKRATLRCHPVGAEGGNTSQVQFEAVVTNDSEWYLIQDNSMVSKLNNPANAGKMFDLGGFDANAILAGISDEAAEIAAAADAAAPATVNMGAVLVETEVATGVDTSGLAGKPKAQANKRAGQQPVRGGGKKDW